MNPKKSSVATDSRSRFTLSIHRFVVSLTALITTQMLLVRRKLLLNLIRWPSHEIHIIGTERRAQVRPTCSIQYLSNMSHGQNLGSTSGGPEFVALLFF
jgi:hypothetical protein